MNRSRGDVSVVRPRDLKCDDFSLDNERRKVLPHVASAPTANVIRVPKRREMPGNALTAYGCYTDSAHFSGEKIACLFMPWNSTAAGEEGCTSRRRQKRRTVFASRSNPRSFPLLANVRPLLSLSLFYLEDEYVLHMHSFINLCRDTASSDIRARVLKRSQETCL